MLGCGSGGQEVDPDVMAMFEQLAARGGGRGAAGGGGGGGGIGGGMAGGGGGGKLGGGGMMMGGGGGDFGGGEVSHVLKNVAPLVVFFLPGDARLPQSWKETQIFCMLG